MFTRMEENGLRVHIYAGHKKLAAKELIGSGVQKFLINGTWHRKEFKGEKEYQHYSGIYGSVEKKFHHIFKKMSGDVGIRGGHRKSLFEQNDRCWT